VQVESGDTLHPRLRDDEDLDGRGHPARTAPIARGRVGEQERVDLKRGVGEQPFHDKASSTTTSPRLPSSAASPTNRNVSSRGSTGDSIWASAIGGSCFGSATLICCLAPRPRAQADDRVLM
jgi:hypothetical protein